MEFKSNIFKNSLIHYGMIMLTILILLGWKFFFIEDLLGLSFFQSFDTNKMKFWILLKSKKLLLNNDF